jgi:hypothetical protein
MFGLVVIMGILYFGSNNLMTNLNIKNLIEAYCIPEDSTLIGRYTILLIKTSTAWTRLPYSRYHIPITPSLQGTPFRGILLILDDLYQRYW